MYTNISSKGVVKSCEARSAPTKSNPERVFINFHTFLLSLYQIYLLQGFFSYHRKAMIIE